MKWTSEHEKNAKDFHQALKNSGCDFFTGVPCSLLGALLAELGKHKHYYPSVREDAAIGMASGAYLAGKKPVVLMQNSGLGYSLNVLTSLNLIYQIPVLLLITYRGLGPDAPEHIVMGKSCQNLLTEVGIESVVPETADLPQALWQAQLRMAETGHPYAIMIKKGIFGA